jgi:hypothetical protein
MVLKSIGNDSTWKCLSTLRRHISTASRIEPLRELSMEAMETCHGVTVVLQQCHSFVAVALRWCYSSATALSQWCYLPAPCPCLFNLHRIY